MAENNDSARKPFKQELLAELISHDREFTDLFESLEGKALELLIRHPAYAEFKRVENRGARASAGDYPGFSGDLIAACWDMRRVMPEIKKLVALDDVRVRVRSTGRHGTIRSLLGQQTAAVVYDSVPGEMFAVKYDDIEFDV